MTALKRMMTRVCEYQQRLTIITMLMGMVSGNQQKHEH